jgi:hypothetical protein
MIRRAPVVFPTRLTARLLLVASLILAGASCGFMDIAENNPHPPAIANLSVVPAAVGPDGILTFTLGYQDSGADMENIFVRDYQSGALLELGIVTDAEGNLTNPFPGTAGTVTFQAGMPGVQRGPHVFKVWAVDGFGSTSNFLEATVVFVY